MLFLKNLIFATRLARAKEMASKRDFLSALEMVEKIFKLYRSGGPSPSSPVLANVFYAELCEKTGKVREVREACAIAMEQLVPGKRNDHLRIEDANYLIFRCKWLLSRISVHDMPEALSEAKIIDVGAGDLKLDMVTPSIKRLLPLSRETALKVDEFISSVR